MYVSERECGCVRACVCVRVCVRECERESVSRWEVAGKIEGAAGWAGAADLHLGTAVAPTQHN